MSAKRAYIKYSPEEMQQARNADMLDVISRFRGYTFKRDGVGYRCIEHNSLVVNADRHHWYWNSQGKGGWGAITWLVDIEGYDFTSAVGVLINKLPDQQQTIQSVKPFKEPPQVQEKRKPFELPQRCDGKYSNVYMYLTKTRCIPPDIVEYCFKQKILYQDIRRNCVFVGYNEQNEAKFAEVRSSSQNTVFRHNIESSDKAYSFNIRSIVPNDRVFVFESPIDLLSHAALNCRNAKKLSDEKGTPYNSSCWLMHNRLSLSGTSYIAVLEEYLKRHKEIKNISCCLDNDETGNRIANTIHTKFTDMGYIVTIHHPRYGKDYNDTLVALTHHDQQTVTPEEQPAVFISNQLKR